MAQMMYGLSLLRDDLLLVDLNGETATVGEIRKEIEEDGVDKNAKWFVAEEDAFSFGARDVLYRYFRDAEMDYMPRGWSEDAWNCLSVEDLAKIEEIINGALAKGENVTKFYAKGNPVDIGK